MFDPKIPSTILANHQLSKPIYIQLSRLLYHNFLKGATISTETAHFAFTTHTKYQLVEDGFK